MDGTENTCKTCNYTTGYLNLNARRLDAKPAPTPMMSPLASSISWSD